MDIAKQLRMTLGPAIDAARAALRDLDADDVPGKLRPVGRRGDGTLPVPLVKALLRGIDEDEWFRSKALEAFDRLGTNDPISGAYLRAEPEWWIAVAAAVADGSVTKAEKRLARLEADLEAARVKSRAEKAKASALKKDLSRAEATAKATIETRLDPMKTAAAEARSEAARSEARATKLRAEMEEMRQGRLESERSAATLAEELRLARKTIADLKRETESGESESMPRDPIDVARWLDRAAAALTPYREATLATPGMEHLDRRERPIVPAGVAPDSLEAIDALAGLDGAVVLIDGHNLLGVLDKATMATARARKELVGALGRLERHVGNARIEVIFDSDLRDGRPVSVTDSGIVVRFAEEGVIADDVIVSLAAEHGGSVVVISDDREVRERCNVYGAAVLWSKALADWL
ncbi:MAG: NYN domain-containing protein [Actinomycetota bacterium]